MTTNNQKIINILIASTKPIPSSELAKAIGISTSKFSNYVRRLITSGKISRVKLPGTNCIYFQFYMTQAQKDAEAEVKPDIGCLVTDTEEIPKRMKFLRMLKEKTVFGEHVTLDLIIEDYTRTMALRQKIVQRIEESE